MAELFMTISFWLARECRFCVRFVGRWLIPWASLSDHLSVRLASQFNVMNRVDSWWLSVGILCILIWLQMIGVIFIVYINGHMGGYGAPRVCVKPTCCHPVIG